MKLYKLKLAALSVDGVHFGKGMNYIRLESAGSPSLSVTFENENTGDAVSLSLGEDAVIPEFDTLLVSHDGAGDQAVSVIVGRDVKKTSSSVAGFVEVVDGGRNRTDAGVAAFTGLGTVGVAGQYPYVQAWNPVGSGRNFIIETIKVSSPTTGDIMFSSYNVAIGSLFRYAKNKKIGNADLAFEMRRHNQASLVGNFFNSIRIAADRIVDFSLREPIVVPPGDSLLITHSVVASSVYAVIECYEEVL